VEVVRIIEIPTAIFAADSRSITRDLTREILPPLLMEKLNAYQRRLVHNFLATMPGIATQSEETDSRFKRITISRTEEA
jgi:hypothetical protein